MSERIPVQPESEMFWEGARNRELRLQYCTNCGSYQFYPRALCKFCKSESLDWKTSSGRGVLVSFSTVYRHHSPHFSTPFTLGVVRLHEGVNMLGKIVNPTEHLQAGCEVEAIYENVHDHTLIHFRVLE